MKKKILFVLCLLLFTGCSGEKKAVQHKNEPYNLTYFFASYTFEKISDNITRVYAVLENTSKNSGNIASISYAVTNKENKIAFHGTKEYNEEFKTGEQKVVIFDVEGNIEDGSGIYVTPFYDNNKKIEIAESKKKYKQVLAVPISREVKELGDKLRIKIGVRFSKKEKIKKLKILVVNEELSPTCITYVNINKTVNVNDKYTYEFECDKNTSLDGTIMFEK